MRSRFQSIVCLLLTAVLLAWSGMRTAGWQTQCEGDVHGPCQAGVTHASIAAGFQHAGSDAASTLAGQQEFFKMPGCGCPPGHVHLDGYPPVIGSAGLTLPQLILVRFSAYPISHAEWAAPLRTAVGPIAFDPVPPGPPPLHLASAPMLI
ncbi:MAG: hypothetical protein JWL81_2184 [Verrucomicrobiales bacterium]|nr:hypothetical protein [Verrucomicrobiales bacterium]